MILTLLNTLVAMVLLAAAARSDPAQAASTPAPQGATPITYLDAPRAIDPALCVAAWPELRDCIEALEARDTLRATACLERAAAAGRSRDGALNLLAEIYRRRGEWDRAWQAIGEAIRLSPRQHLHRFRQALIAFEQRRRASFFLSKWTWHLRTKDAYERALALSPRTLPYRYYVFYSYLNTPRIGGGDGRRALAIAQEGIDLGLRECYLFRADALLHLGRYPEAFAGYDTSIVLGLFKKNLESFKAASAAAIERQDWGRARRYCDYLVECRPDLAGSYNSLGDYFLATRDTTSAVRAFHTALEKDPSFAPAAAKLKNLESPG